MNTNKFSDFPSKYLLSSWLERLLISCSLEVHHRTYERFGNAKLSDVYVLCKTCHKIFTKKNKQTRDSERKKVVEIANYERKKHEYLKDGDLSGVPWKFAPDSCNCFSVKNIGLSPTPPIRVIALEIDLKS